MARSIEFYEALGFGVVDLDGLRQRLIGLGFEAGEIGGGAPGPDRELCVRDPHGHGHMVAELWDESIGSDPRPRLDAP